MRVDGGRGLARGGCERPVKVYRLDVLYPLGSRDGNGAAPVGWQPEGWTPGDWGTMDLETGAFQWPRERKFLSIGGATQRAELLRKWGCRVVIIASKPVEWPDI